MSVGGSAIPPDITEADAPRPTRAPKLLAVDLDGTCLDRNQQLHPQIQEALIAAGKRMPVVVATGRMFVSALPWAEKLQVSAPMICYQGALVKEMPKNGGTVIHEDSLDVEAALTTLRITRAHGWHHQVHQNDVLYAEENRPEVQLYMKIAAVPMQLVDDLEPVIRNGVTTKMVCIDEDARVARECKELLQTELGDLANVTTSMAQFVEIVSHKTNKGNALKIVCEHFGVDIQDTVAIGDAGNDVDLVTTAGFGVAVNTAPPALLQVAIATCGPPEAAGVADVVRALNLA